MFARLLLLFIVVPLVELAILLRLAKWTSPLLTVGLVILTGIVGAALARWQGFHTLSRIQRELGSGRVPSSALLDALMILLASALLLTPGILTDLFGFSLLIPSCRSIYRAWIARYFQHRIDIHVQSFSGASPDSRDPNTLDSTARRVDFDE